MREAIVVEACRVASQHVEHRPTPPAKTRLQHRSHSFTRHLLAQVKRRLLRAGQARVAVRLDLTRHGGDDVVGQGLDLLVLVVGLELRRCASRDRRVSSGWWLIVGGDGRRRVHGGDCVAEG